MTPTAVSGYQGYVQAATRCHPVPQPPSISRRDLCPATDQLGAAPPSAALHNRRRSGLRPLHIQPKSLDNLPDNILRLSGGTGGKQHPFDVVIHEQHDHLSV